MGMQVGWDNCTYVHVVYMPYLNTSKEIKSKPAQTSVRELRGLGILPNILVARSEEPAPESIKRKLSLYCGVSEQAIALLPNAKSIYEVPLTLEDSGVADVICKRLDLGEHKADLTEWRKVVAKAVGKQKHKVHVGVVAKYLDNQDTYMSVFEAIKAAGWHNDAGVTIDWVDAEELGQAKDPGVILKKYDGIVVPGGFGSRGVEGKIRAAQYALTHKLPYLGLCYGLQMAVIAAARNAGLVDAHTTEVSPDTANPVITTMDGQKGLENTGGTMRLGDYNCDLAEGTLAAKVYGTAHIVERHRHRYECAEAYKSQYESWGIVASGINPDNDLVEVIEAAPSVDHPFFLASQFHPELKSRPNRAHPMFDGFIASLIKR
jgi:CTP synthase